MSVAVDFDVPTERSSLSGPGSIVFSSSAGGFPDSSPRPLISHQQIDNSSAPGAQTSLVHMQTQVCGFPAHLFGEYA